VVHESQSTEHVDRLLPTAGSDTSTNVAEINRSNLRRSAMEERQRGKERQTTVVGVCPNKRPARFDLGALQLLLLERYQPDGIGVVPNGTQ